ncbi:MAG: NAD(P)-dependent oxidoreductase [Cyclobacteriaceae bacterium]
MPKRILITGANGFLGQKLCEVAQSIGFDVFAGVRASANTKSLKSIGVQLLEIDYSSQSSIESSLKQSGRDQFDFVIHNAGLTHSIRDEDFYRINTDMTDHLLSAINRNELIPPSGKFIYISSMAARGPRGTGGPVSAYGKSKLMAEEHIKSKVPNYLIFRPTAIYGPGDMAFLSLFKAAKLGWYPMITRKNHIMTFIHGLDVANNIFSMMIKLKNSVVHLDNGIPVTHVTLKATLSMSINKKLRNLFIPSGIMIPYLYLADIINHLFNVKPEITKEKWREIGGDWDHDLSDERQKWPIKEDFTLEMGISETMEYYQKNRLI